MIAIRRLFLNRFILEDRGSRDRFLFAFGHVVRGYVTKSRIRKCAALPLFCTSPLCATRDVPATALPVQPRQPSQLFP